MSRTHNFSAGPAYLPESVVTKLQQDLWELDGCGEGLMETSHRAKAFDAVLQSAKARVRRLLKLSDDQSILFLHGGARTQFFMVPMNLLQGGRATYLDTGIWSQGAASEAERYGTVDTLFSSADTAWDHIPADGAWGELPQGTRYLHYTSNNTVAGSEYLYTPTLPKGVWRIADMSSDILSREIDGSAFDLIYAGAQKNLGTAGTTLVVIRNELIERSERNLPMMLRYDVHASHDSCYNTPATFAIAVLERVLAWLEDDVGGVAKIEAHNKAKADALYAEIDRSGFWTGRVAQDSRSRMNITFRSPDADLDKAFIAQAAAQGLHGLKGHRTVGGIRASLYNAQTDGAVRALIEAMRAFEAKHG